MTNIDYIKLPTTVSGKELVNYAEKALEEYVRENEYQVKVEKTSGIVPGPQKVESYRKIKLNDKPIPSPIDRRRSLTRLSTEIDVNSDVCRDLEFSEVKLGEEEILSIAEKLYERFG